MGEPVTSLSLGEAAASLGVSRLRLWRACKNLGVVGHRNPTDRRQRLLQPAEIQHAASALLAGRHRSSPADSDRWPANPS